MVFVTESLMYSTDFLSKESPLYDKKTHKVVDDPFTFLTVEQIRDLMNDNGCNEYKFIASDGYSELLAPQINKLNDEAFKNWVEYHLYTCEKIESLNASHHLLYVTKK